MFNRQLPAVTLEAEDFKQAHRDLARQGLTGSMLYAAVWAVVVLFTPVVVDWPILTWSGLGALALIGAFRFSLGLLFDRAYTAWGARVWAAVYYSAVLIQVGTWSTLYTFLIWHYHASWPTMLLSFASAGIVAGGTITLSTHPPLQRTYILVALIPGMIAFWLTGDNNAMVMGMLLAAKIVFLRRRRSSFCFLSATTSTSVTGRPCAAPACSSGARPSSRRHVRALKVPTVRKASSSPKSVMNYVHR